MFNNQSGFTISGGTFNNVRGRTIGNYADIRTHNGRSTSSYDRTRSTHDNRHHPHAAPQSRETTQSTSFSPPPRTQTADAAFFAQTFDSSSRPPPSVQNTSNYKRRTMSGNYNTRVVHSSDEFLEAVSGTGMFNNCSNFTVEPGSTITVTTGSGTQINYHYRHTENNVRSRETTFMDFHSDSEDRYSEEVLDESGGWRIQRTMSGYMLLGDSHSSGRFGLPSLVETR
ncbi:hypothetical protein Moror_5775 [Moniliophthora roreri MCA 2997]|uniref:Uncharacterized protein n=1 Tax=Moniliophthora roreri (strain MCA 2997) TaxID=1381753 RepID=V2Y6J1_MONRO|nr:hypothetical protein Moror_5775 [Moniliophthora roreri MCA 2997]